MTLTHDELNDLIHAREVMAGQIADAHGLPRAWNGSPQPTRHDRQIADVLVKAGLVLVRRCDGAVVEEAHVAGGAETLEWGVRFPSEHIDNCGSDEEKARHLAEVFTRLRPDQPALFVRQVVTPWEPVAVDPETPTPSAQAALNEAERRLLEHCHHDGSKPHKCDTTLAAHDAADIVRSVGDAE